jgi:hypothetical protein
LRTTSADLIFSMKLQVGSLEIHLTKLKIVLVLGGMRVGQAKRSKNWEPSFNIFRKIVRILFYLNGASDKGFWKFA